MHDVEGNAPGPQVVTCTRLICADAGEESKDAPAIRIEKIVRLAIKLLIKLLAAAPFSSAVFLEPS